MKKIYFELKIPNLCSLKEIIYREKRQMQFSRQYRQYIYKKGLISKIYQELSKLNIKKQQQRTKFRNSTKF